MSHLGAMMRYRALYLSIFLAVCPHAHSYSADRWSSAIADNEKFTFHLSKDSYRKIDDNTFEILLLFNYKEPQAGGFDLFFQKYKSLGLFETIYCLEKRHDAKFGYFYKEAMGTGDLIKSVKPDKGVQPVIPGSYIDLIYQDFCKR
jgi:Surface-adhesin protein E